MLNSELSSGISFPKARENALRKYLNIPEDDTSLSINTPNNILGIEYLKALKKYNSNIKPISVKRIDSGYNDLEYSNNMASATAIRQLIKNGTYDNLNNLLPKKSYKILMDSIKSENIVPDLSCFEKEIIYTLRKLTVDEISHLPDVSEGLENSIKKSALNFTSLSDLLESLKSKRYTRTRIQRILTYALIGITKEDIELSKNITPYIRVLGFNKNGKKILSEISKAKPELKIITSVKKFVDSNTNKDLELLLNKDILATNIYTLAYKNKLANLDFTKSLINL